MGYWKGHWSDRRRKPIDRLVQQQRQPKIGQETVAWVAGPVPDPLAREERHLADGGRRDRLRLHELKDVLKTHTQLLLHRVDCHSL